MKGSELVTIFFDNEIIYISDSYEELLGYSIEYLKKNTLKRNSKILPTKERAITGKYIKEAISKQQTDFYCELTLTDKFQQKVFSTGRVEIVYNKKGEVKHLIHRGTYSHKNSRIFKGYEEKLENRNKVIETLSKVADETLSDENTPLVFSRAMRIVGKNLNADRIYYFRWFEDEQVTSQLVEWTYEGTEPQINNPDLQRVPFSDIKDFVEAVSKKEPYIRIVEKIQNQKLKTNLKNQNIKSVAIVPVAAGDSIYGFLGVDDCQIERKWNSFELQSLQSLANLFASGLSNIFYQKELEIKRNELSAVLNGIDDIVFTANWKTLEFEFKNSNFIKYISKVPNIDGKISSLIELVRPEEQVKVQRFVRKVFTEGFAKTRFQTNQENKFQWVEYSNKIVQHPSFDSPFLLGVIRDISKEHIAKQETIKAIENKQIAEKKIAELEVRTLQMQMNPHFIFNALNSIQSYIINNEPLAANEYLSNFSHLMRLFLDSSRNKYVNIRDELKLIELYIQVEKSRSPKSFDYEINVDTSVNLNAEIPSMIIQPFIENAINHGLRYKNRKGNLTVTLYEENQSMIAAISDDGIGIEKSLEVQKKMKYGYKSQALKITEERIQIYNMNNKGKMSYTTEPLLPDSDEPGLKVIVTFPTIEDKNKI